MMLNIIRTKSRELSRIYVNSNKNVALQILSSVNQNDAWIQNQSINTGALELTELIQKETDLNVCSNMMGTISSIVRGENL